MLSTKIITKGKLIVFEGLDGCGKSTQSKLLAKYLKSQKKPTINVTNPTDSLIGGLIRGRLKKEWNCSPYCLQLLFAADREYLTDKTILPTLNKGVNIVSDRYNYSTIAYGSLDCNREWLEAVNSRFELPDLVIFLDVPPEICVERMKEERESLELYETTEKLVKIRTNYINLLNKLILENKTKYVIIDGNKTIQEIADVVNTLMKEIII